MRAAIYYAPSSDDLLWHAGRTWLGRDPATDAPCPQPAIDNLPELTRDAAHYGFHATLKPPMRLRHGLPALRDATAALAARLAPFPLPRLAVTELEGFLALCPLPDQPDMADLQRLADVVIAELDPHRAPPSPEELARRRTGGLSAEQEAMLQRWGYPAAFATWRFHMTISRRLTPDEAARLRPLAEAHFAAALALPRKCDALCVFTQPAPDAPFSMARRLALGQGRPA